MFLGASKEQKHSLKHEIVVLTNRIKGELVGCKAFVLFYVLLYRGQVNSEVVLELQELQPSRIKWSKNKVLYPDNLHSSSIPDFKPIVKPKGFKLSIKKKKRKRSKMSKWHSTEKRLHIFPLRSLDLFDMPRKSSFILDLRLDLGLAVKSWVALKTRLKTWQRNSKNYFSTYFEKTSGNIYSEFTTVHWLKTISQKPGVT